MCVSESQRDVEWVEDSLCHVELASTERWGGGCTIAAQCDGEALQSLSKPSISAGASAAPRSRLDHRTQGGARLQTDRADAARLHLHVHFLQESRAHIWF